MAKVAAPTGGKESEAPPAPQTGGTDAPPASGQAPAPETGDDHRETMIPRERFDEVKAKADRVEELESEVSTLREQVNAKPQEGAAKTWADVPDETLNAILANPIKYPEHYAGARAEEKRRIILAATTGATQAMTLDQLRSKETEAFDASKPLGKEVKRILAPGRSDAEYMQDAIELARYRLTAKPTNGVAPSTLAANLANALQTPPGGTKSAEVAPPNWSDMSSEEFEKQRQAVLLGRGT